MSSDAAPETRQSLKQIVFELLEGTAAGHPMASIVDRVIITLIFINIAAVSLDTVPEIHQSHGLLIAAIEWVTVALFAVEYALRLWVADLHLPLKHLRPGMARLVYAVQPAAIVDLLAILPPLIALAAPGFPVATLVVFRLLRFLKLARYSPGMRSLLNALRSEQRALVASGVIILGLIFASASLMHTIEGHVQPEAFGSVPAAIYWAVMTVTTVGYGDVVPITPAGKFVAGVSMILGFSLFALPIGIIATAFAREIHQRDFVVTWGMLARVPLFAKLGAADIAAIMPLLHGLNVREGTMITYAGERATSMYFIASGTVEIDVNDEKFRLTDGGFFGEIAMLKRTVRAADVVAISDCSLLVLEVEDFQRLMARRPQLAKQMQPQPAPWPQTGRSRPGAIFRSTRSNRPKPRTRAAATRRQRRTPRTATAQGLSPMWRQRSAAQPKGAADQGRYRRRTTRPPSAAN